jgi:hypothetical protein
MVVRAALVIALLAGCRDVPARDPETSDAPVVQIDGAVLADGALVIDAGPDASLDAPIDYGEDGMPTRLPCVVPDGTAMADGVYGRLDGILVAVAPPGTADRTCHPDSEHVHLQVRASGMTYDIAVNVGNDVHSQTLDRALFAPAWTEGWQPGGFVEYTGLGIHSDTIPLPGTGVLIQDLVADLATANHISIYATGYGPDGAHLVHRNGGGRDGLIVTHPLAAMAHARAFSFSSQDY